MYSGTKQHQTHMQLQDYVPHSFCSALYRTCENYSKITGSFQTQGFFIPPYRTQRQPGPSGQLIHFLLGSAFEERKCLCFYGVNKTKIKRVRFVGDIWQKPNKESAEDTKKVVVKHFSNKNGQFHWPCYFPVGIRVGSERRSRWPLITQGLCCCPTPSHRHAWPPLAQGFHEKALYVRGHSLPRQHEGLCVLYVTGL